MKEYKLTTKDGEILKKVKAESMEIAIDMFCEIKKLDRERLLSIYEVEIVR